MLLERTAFPEERSVELLERLVVVPEVLRAVLSLWVAELVERLVVEPVLRLVRSFWTAVPEERLVVEPEVERLVLPF